MRRYPSMGSLRVVAGAGGAHVGDLLFVRAVGPAQFDFRVVTRAQLTAAPAGGWVGLLCGNPAASADVTAALATALGFPDPAGAGPEDVLSMLSARHDHDLLRVFKESMDS
jgi:hypothetical protein